MSHGVAVPRRTTCYITNFERKLARLIAAFKIRVYFHGSNNVRFINENCSVCSSAFVLLVLVV